MRTITPTTTHLVKMAQRAAPDGVSPLGTRTRATASPSGTLWIASVAAINTPNSAPEVWLPNDTPMPTYRDRREVGGGGGGETREEKE